MNYGEMSQERIIKLRLNELKEGTSVLYCPVCEWHIVNAGMSPFCPACRTKLGIVTVKHNKEVGYE